MPNNPREFDAVLGAQQLQPPIHGAVLGGIENVKKCLASDNSSVKITALSNALKYGEPGLDLVIKALKDKSDDVQRKALMLLCGRSENKVQQALRAYYRPHLGLGCLHTLVGHEGSVNCVAVSPNGKTLFSGGSDGTIRVWDEQTGKLKYTQDAKSGSITSLSVSPSGKNLVNTSSDHKIKIWDIRREKITFKQILKIQLGVLVSFVALGYDKQTIFCGTPNNGIQIHNIDTGIYTNLGGTQAVAAYAISSDRQTIVSGKHNINVWDANTQKLKHTIQSPSEVKLLAITPDKTTLVGACANNTINVWNIATREIKYTNERYLDCLIISPNGQNFITGNHSYVTASDINTGKKSFSVARHLEHLYLERVNCLAITPNRGFVIAGSVDGTITIWGMCEW